MKYFTKLGSFPTKEEYIRENVEEAKKKLKQPPTYSMLLGSGLGGAWGFPNPAAMKKGIAVGALAGGALDSIGRHELVKTVMNPEYREYKLGKNYDTEIQRAANRLNRVTERHAKKVQRALTDADYEKVQKIIKDYYDRAENIKDI